MVYQKHHLTAISKAVTDVLDSVKPPPNITISEWADEYRIIPRGTASEYGKWRTYRTAYLKKIMDCITDPTVTNVTLKTSSQVGKTELLLNIIGYFVQYDPSPILVVTKDLKLAQQFSKDRLAPMIRSMPMLKKLFHGARSRTSGNTILEKSFVGGQIAIVGSNSPASLASRPIRILLFDEVDRYYASAGTEGDPIELALRRTTTFWNKKIVAVSSPGTKGSSRIQKEYEKSNQGLYKLQCPSCGELDYITHKAMVYERDDNDKLIDVKGMCSKCGSLHSELEWKSTTADWVFQNPEVEKHCGFELNTYVSPWVSWLEIELGFLDAKKSPETLQTYINTVFAELWEEPASKVDEQVLFDRRESYQEIPLKACVLTMGVDVQKDRLEAEVVAWSEGEESWNIDYQVFRGDPDEIEVWKNLAYFIEHKKYKHQSGIEIGISATAIDLQGHHTQKVYEFCYGMKTLRVWPVRGTGGPGKPFVKSGKAKIDRFGTEIKIYNLAIDSIKLWMKRRLDQKEVGAGFCHFPMDRDIDYFRGLTAEKLKETEENGVIKYEWVCEPGVRNEPHDCRNYAYAAVKMLNPQYQMIRENLGIDLTVEFEEISVLPGFFKNKRKIRVGTLSEGVSI